MAHRITGAPTRVVAAVVVIAAVVATVVVLRARADDGDAVTGNKTPAADAYVGPVFHLCSNETAVANGLVESGQPPVVGQPAPDVALCDRSGAFVTKLSDMRGRVVWLNFWATWCVPCKRELPDIQALYEEFRGEGLEVLVINYGESETTALEFLPGLGVSMPVVIDRSGDIYDRYRLTGLPDSFWVDRDGNLAAVYYGYVNEEIARGRLRTAGIGVEGS